MSKITSKHGLENKRRNKEDLSDRKEEVSNNYRKCKRNMNLQSIRNIFRTEFKGPLYKIRYDCSSGALVALHFDDMNDSDVSLMRGAYTSRNFIAQLPSKLI